MSPRPWASAKACLTVYSLRLERAPKRFGAGEQASVLDAAPKVPVAKGESIAAGLKRVKSEFA